MSRSTPSTAPPNEVVISIAGKVDERTHAFDGNPEGRTVCGLYPDKLMARTSWKIVPFVRCPICEEMVARDD